MPKHNLTQAVVVEKLPTSSANTVHWDTGLTGFGVRVGPKGCKTFIAQYRVTGG